MRIAVIVDDLDESRRRRCFWPEQLDRMQEVSYEQFSLLAQMEERKFFDVYAFDVIIFNWCVLDGSLMYASDRVQRIVEFYDDHFVQFVRRGGTLIMENQPKRWRPTQAAYDVLLNGDVTVLPREPYFFSNRVFVNERLKRHPLVRHLPVELLSSYSHPHSESWFPPDSTSNRSIQELHPTKAYSGAFSKWGDEWLPLLYTDDKKHPVLLAKTDGLGLWLVSTMYLASSNIPELLDSLILGSRRNSLAVQKFHERQRIVRRLYLARAVGLSLLAAAAIYLFLASGVITADIPYGNTVVGNAVFSILLAAALSMATAMRRRVTNWVRAALNR